MQDFNDELKRSHTHAVYSHCMQRRRN